MAQLGSEPPTIPILGAEPDRCQLLHPLLTGDASGSSSPTAGPNAWVQGEGWVMLGVLHWAGWRGPCPGCDPAWLIQGLCWSSVLGWCRGMPSSCPAGIPVFSLGFPFSIPVLVGPSVPPPARPRGGCWGPLLDRKGIWCCFLSTPTPWSSQPHWKHMCPGWGGRTGAMLPLPGHDVGVGSCGCPG